ncbi:glycerol-3-phosphate dehydrogenase [Rhodothermaceae bacterium RA]|nr:glycerol-3-phosphate dehydrogenase [Rhodothermaceae bacterium RA]
MSRTIAIFGAGSWGTALAVSLAHGGQDVMLWARRPDAAAAMARTRHNPTYLPEAAIPEAVRITADLAEAAERAHFWVIATPSQSVRALARQLEPHVHDDLIVVSLAKGIENGTLMTTTQVLRDVLRSVPSARIGVLYGPSHAEEVALGKPTTLVAAAPSLAVAHVIQSVFMTPRLRVYVNDDVLGVEIGGSVKNVLAIAAGMSDGVGFGDNAKAALITRGLAEIQRLGLAMGADAATFSGLAGIGDLVVTCMSRHSRNRYLGEQIGRGRTLEEVEAEMQMVAEGVRTTVSVCELARRHGIEMPITEAVHAILFEGKRPAEAVEELMSRSAKHEEWLPKALQP